MLLNSRAFPSCGDGKNDPLWSGLNLEKKRRRWKEKLEVMNWLKEKEIQMQNERNEKEANILQ